MARRALAISRRSMVLIKRPNKVVEGVRPIEAVLDILIPWLQYSGSLRFALGTDLRIPDARNNRLVCIAAYSILQCNISFRELRSLARASKRAARTGGPDVRRKCGRLFGGDLP